jgi:hypothetical protein
MPNNKIPNHIVIYKGERVYPNHVSNLDVTCKDNISVQSKYYCKCGSIFQNRSSGIFYHKQSTRHQRHFKNNLNLSNEDMFELYRV